MNLRAFSLAALLAALPTLAPGAEPFAGEVRLAQPEPFKWELQPPSLEASDLRLRASDFLPPSLEQRPGRMVSFGSAMFGLQIASLVLFPPQNWSGGARPRAAQFLNAFQAAPVWDDGDPWTTNFVLHPLMGSLLYTAARRSNYGPVGAFLFASAASTVWEYGVESWFEQPSWPDLLVTSTTGALIGEARWWARQRLLREGRPGFWGQVGLTFADPITEAQLLFQTIAGRKAARDLFGDELL
jgi:hypothetical protein